MPWVGRLGEGSVCGFAAHPSDALEHKNRTSIPPMKTNTIPTTKCLRSIFTPVVPDACTITYGTAPGGILIGNGTPSPVTPAVTTPAGIAPAGFSVPSSVPSHLHTLWSKPQRVSPGDISFIKTKERYGWMHCMSAFHVDWEGIRFPSAEHLFQWLRFSAYPEVQDKILATKSPMAAKWVAQDHKGLLGRTAWDESQDDIPNMRRVLRHKLADHPDLAQKLKATGQAVLIEDCSSRDRDSARFWGAVKIGDKWHGENVLGCLWMEQRDLL